MKKLFFILFLFINATLFAQTGKGFATDSANIINFANSVVATAKNSYQPDKVFRHRFVVELWYRSSLPEKIRMEFRILPDKTAILVHLTGYYEDIFPYWKKYYQPDADMTDLEKAGKTQTTAPFLQGQVKSFFNKIMNKLWEVKSGYIPDPVKKQK